MPIYEYRCQGCGVKFEKLVRRVTDEASIECPVCGCGELGKEYSTFAPQMGAGKSEDAPMCPSGGCCPTPGKCGLN